MEPKYLINTANTVALFSLEDPQKGYQKVNVRGTSSDPDNIKPLVYPLGKNIDISTLSVNNNLISVRDLGTRFLREVATGKFLGKINVTGYLTNPTLFLTIAPKLEETPVDIKDSNGLSILYKNTFTGAQLGFTAFVVYKHLDTDGSIKYKTRIVRNVAITSVSIEAGIDSPVKFTIDAQYGNETIDTTSGTTEPTFAITTTENISEGGAIQAAYDSLSSDDANNVLDTDNDGANEINHIFKEKQAWEIYDDLENNVYTYAYGYLYLGDDDDTAIFTGLDMNEDKKQVLVSSFKVNFKVDTELLFGLGERLSQGFVAKALDIDMNLTIRQADLDKLIEFYGQDAATTTVGSPQIRTKRYGKLILYLYNGKATGSPSTQTGDTRYFKIIVEGVYPEELSMSLKTGGEIIETELSFKGEMATFEEVTDKLYVLDISNETIKTE